MMDVVDRHFVQCIDRVLICRIFGGLDDYLEPGGIGPPFFIQEDVADAVKIGGFHLHRIIAFIVIDLVVFGEQEGDHCGFRDRWLVDGWHIFWHDQWHDPGFCHRCSEDEKSDQQEAEVDHGGQVYTGGALLALFYAGAFFVGGVGGVVEFCHGIVLCQ